MNNMILSLDLGSSAVKAAVFENCRLRNCCLLAVMPGNYSSSIGDLMEKLAVTLNLRLSQLTQLILTGTGESAIADEQLPIPAVRVSELQAIGRGGLLVSGLSSALVTSLGTGTALVWADETGCQHLGGSGIGGGTLEGLGRWLCGLPDSQTLSRIALDGDISAVDLRIIDLSTNAGLTLPPDLTASNFGKRNDNAKKADLAAGCINMVLETAGVLSILAVRPQSSIDIVLTGTLTELPQARPLFARMSDLYQVQFRIPELAVYATALGAAACALSPQTLTLNSYRSK